MAKVDSLTPRVVSGPVKRYGAQGQDRQTFHNWSHDEASKRDKFVKKADRSRQSRNEEAMAKIVAKKGKMAVEAIDVAKIQWVAKRGVPPLVVNCSHLIDVVKKLMTSSPSVYDPLYEVLTESLKEHVFHAIERFYLVATGVVPARKDELGAFIRMKVREEMFVLPRSFLSALEGCRPTCFLLPPPR